MFYILCQIVLEYKISRKLLIFRYFYFTIAIIQFLRYSSMLFEIQLFENYLYIKSRRETLFEILTYTWNELE